MALSLFNTDSSYFKVTSPDIKAQDAVLSKNIIEFTFTEESGRGKIDTGNVQILDPGNNYSKILRTGASVEVEWGYDRLLPSLSDLIGAPLDLGPPAFGPQNRLGFRGTLQNPGGSGNSSGQSTMSVNFFGREILGGKVKKKYTNTTKGLIVLEVFARMGIFPPLANVLFTESVIPLLPNVEIVQRESDYQFLRRLAGEWRCLFRTGYTPAGIPTGVFINYNAVQTNTFTTFTTLNAGGNYYYLNYKNAPANVIDYTWNQKNGFSGGGDNVRIVNGPDGRPQFFRTVARGETVLTYKFNPERVGRELRSKEGLDRAELLVDFLGTTDFQKVIRFFDPVEQSTAPQGYGYEIKANVLGNPLLTPPLKIVFGDGFPPLFASVSEALAPTNFYCNKVTHKINKDGYRCELQILDALSITGGSLF